MMLLTTFIETHPEEILADWDSFAGKLFGDSNAPSMFLLRDHAAEILVEIVSDIRRIESLEQQKEKSMSVLWPPHLHETAADIHGVLRHDAGLSVSFVAAEFRALRASVLALWLPHIAEPNDEQFAQMIRFNEAIDGAMADSLASFEFSKAA
jgi:hypothetical protein